MRCVGFTLVVVLTTLAAACSSSGSHGASSTTTAPSTTAPTTVAACNRRHASGQSAQSFTFDGQTRTYQLYVPPVYDGTRDVPVVFDFHGFGSNAVEQMLYSNFKPEADRDDFLIVAPDGQDAANGRHFNVTREPGLQNDVQMVGSLLDHIEASLCVDTRRVYSTGMSDGGAMTSVLACTMPNRFAAFAAVAVVIYSNGCGQGRAIPITAFSGTADPIVPFNGGKVNCCGGTTVGAAPTAMANWAKAGGCDAKYTDTNVGSDVVERAWHGCRTGGAVVFYIVEGGGHTWPGAIPVPRLGKTTDQINATETIWTFFQAHPLP